MRRWLPLALLGLPIAALPAQEAKDPLAVGKSLPATFHAYNVNVVAPPAEEVVDDKAKARPTPYSTKLKFHCLITEYDLDPAVMLLARGTEANDALKDLLKKLDKAIEDNRRFVRLRAFIVFVPDDLANLAEEDDKREAAAKKLEALADDLKLRHVVIALAAKPDLEKYQLGDAALTAVLYKKLKVLAAHRFAADRIDEAAAKAVMTDLKGKLGAKR
ncbi:MAG: hypothetical protein U0797_05190 [Gemmataceae bacterium]